jgi:hypothetical protein
MLLAWIRPHATTAQGWTKGCIVNGHYQFEANFWEVEKANLLVASY